MNLPCRSTDKTGSKRILRPFISTKLIDGDTVERNKTRTSRLMVAVLALTTGIAAPRQTSGADAPARSSPKLSQPLSLAETALARLALNDTAGAAHNARLALRAAPGDATINALAGAILLNAGDSAGARTAFENALTGDPNDPLALYGVGLAQVAQGSRAGALNRFTASEKNGGDKTYLLLARQYVQWLDGVQMTLPDNGGMPDAFAPGQHALRGMSLMRQGGGKKAVTELEIAQDAAGSDPIVPPSGILMTFDTGKPLTAGGPALPADNGLAAALPKQKGLSGTVQVSPDNAPGSVAYVSYMLDGQSLGFVNVPPFELNWDTRQTANGWHTLIIALFDRDASEIYHVTKRVRTANSLRDLAADISGSSTEQTNRVRLALWQSLVLRPDRYALAYALGASYRASGAAATARVWFTRAAGSRPDSPNIHGLLASCGGIGVSGETLWGGLNDEKLVALTFDDGPKPGVTEPLLDVLTQWQVPATFFVIGRHVMEYPELTRQIDRAGMEIANHSYTHPNLTKLSETRIAQEILRTQAAVQTVVGKTPRYLRPPGGNWNPKVAAVARTWGLTPCMWTVDVYGSEVIGAQQVADAVLAQVRPGAIVLMHNGKVSTLQALPTIIKELRRRGYSFATVDALARRYMAAKESARQAARVAATPHRAE